LIYAGTDDGIIQVTEDGGVNWRRIPVGDIRGVPSTAFVNDIKADLHDPNKVYVVMDNHKYGDFKPYIVMSTDRGRSWSSLRSDLPEPLLVWRIVQDHEDEDLLFLATEFGIYFSLDAGKRWVKFTGGLPTISFRDLAIQRRENDLVGASFGRGFYVLDDYSFLRQVSKEELAKEATIFDVEDAHWYIRRPVLSFDEKGSQGAGYYTAPNPPFGATFTYHLREGSESMMDKRKMKEKEMSEDGKATSFLGWDVLDKELMEEDPKMIAVIRDSNGELVRKMKVPDSEGFHRVTWNLRRPSPRRVLLDEKPIGAPEDEPTAMMVAPGRYSVQLVRMDGGQAQVLGEPKEFNLIKLRDGALPAAEPEVVAGFWKELEDFQRNLSAISYELRRAENRVRAMQIALKRSPAEIGQLDEQLHDCLMGLKELDARIYGSPKKREVMENTRPTLGDRFGFARTGVSNSTYGPTAAHRESFDLAKKEMDEIQRDAMDILGTRIPAIEKALIANGAPWVEGQGGGFGE
jgi:hypothetical protein